MPRKKKAPEYTVIFNAQITIVMDEDSYKALKTDKEFANSLKTALEADDVVITDRKTFIG